MQQNNKNPTYEPFVFGSSGGIASDYFTPASFPMKYYPIRPF